MTTRPVYSFPKEPDKTTAWKDPLPVIPANDRAEVVTGIKDDSMLRDRERDAALERTTLIKKAMSPPGSLNLPPLLEKHRLQYGIPDGCFRYQALFDRVHIFQIDLFENSDFYEGTSIHRPNLKQRLDKEEAHRGIIISAGLKAADNLMSHGVGLGHIVGFLRNAPFRHHAERLGGNLDIFYLVMRDGDITSSETQMEDIRTGRTRIVDVGGDGEYCHQIEGLKKHSVFVSDLW